MSAEARDPATEGMVGGGYYDHHSEYQQVVAGTAAELLEESVAALAATSPPFVIADYGCAEGANSMRSVGTVIAARRRTDPHGAVVVIHNDLPTNDWNQLFRDVSGPDGYLTDRGDVLPMASARSFFEPAAPAASVHVGMSFSAAHWLSARPEVTAPDALYFDRLDGAALRLVEEQAAADWARFLEARAADLAPGGRMLVQMVGSVVDEPGRRRATASALLWAMQEVAQTLVADGMLDQGALDRYVLPVYARTEAEAAAPLAHGALAQHLEVERISTAPVPSPYEQKRRDGADADEYAGAYAGFVRGFTESTLRDGLFGPGTASDAAANDALEAFYQRLQARFAAHPGEDAFEDWTLTVLVRRR